MSTSDHQNFDVFVSYAHVDDHTTGKALGFITRFCKAIETMGQFKRGRAVRLFLDGEMASGVDWTAEIKRALESSLIFLPVLSASWQNSEYCGLEWSTYQKAFPERFDAGPQKPVFPILFETDTKSLTSELRKLEIKYRFTYTMTTTQFNRVADAMTTELVGHLKRIGGGETFNQSSGTS
jgi:hypothetical protein